MLDIAEELNRWVERGRDFAVATGSRARVAAVTGPRAPHQREVYSSRRSRKSTTAPGTLLTPPSKMRRGVMPAP